ncbi:MAG: hypothetical protein IJO22_03890 [Oscillospiraceae bacterium]|nr:hypothetical protein [Oscillospiraceae bacterium]
MKPSAIVYSSNTGFTERYAKILGEKTGLPVYPIKNAPEKGTAIIYMGWLMAGTVADYKKAAKKYDIKAVCGTSLAPTGTLVDAMRKSCKLSEDFPVFNVQAGMNRSKLKGGYAFGIKMLTKFMSKKKNRTAEEEGMFELLLKGGDYVSEENLSGILEWYKNA